jgi:flavin reductase (DIM6/NTAB) family NADH-FMN oxidoreductase RutF
MPSPAPEEFRRAMSSLPTGVTIVSALGGDGPAGATANAVASLSLDPPLMLAALDRGSRTLPVVDAAGTFAVNVLRAEHADLARSFATKAPHTEKWRERAWSERAGTPVLDDALAWVACELRDRHEGGDHVVLIGEVVELDSSDGEPLVFWAGSYRGLGE